MDIILNILNKFKEVRSKNLVDKYSTKINNMSFFLTFLAVRKYIDLDMSNADKFKSRRMLNKIYGYKSSFYYFIDEDFFFKSNYLFSYINDKEDIFNLSSVFEQFINDHPNYFNEKEVIKIKYLFKKFEENPKFHILKIFNAKKSKIPSLAIDYYVDNFKDNGIKNISKIRKYYKYLTIICLFIFITFFI